MKLPQFFTAITLCFLLGWGVFVLVPLLSLGAEGPLVNEDEGTILPPSPSGSAMAGEQVYRDQGCVYCHSQVVTAEKFGVDVAKGWGPRPTVARDYIVREQAYPGIRRFGPDLAAAGWSGWEKDGLDRDKIYRHLFDPRIDNPMSNAPSYRFLFEYRKVWGQPADNALKVGNSVHKPQAGYQVVPKREAVELVDYLLSLNPNYALPEAPLPAAPAAPAPAAK
jgi:cytochrome c oxidase cbb3-type subunit 2